MQLCLNPDAQCECDSFLHYIGFFCATYFEQNYSHNFTFPSDHITQFGHNLGYAHSNELGPYEDQTDVTGYGYFLDDGPVMCFDGTKSWQIGATPNVPSSLSPWVVVLMEIYKALPTLAMLHLQLCSSRSTTGMQQTQTQTPLMHSTAQLESIHAPRRPGTK